jgi:alpha-galactosidase
MQTTLVAKTFVVLVLAGIMFSPVGDPTRVLAAPREAAVILTPKPSAAPRINGARVFGVRPGSPFLFTIPASGERPMQFAVDNLPDGLKVDAATGQITGSLQNRGEYIVTFRAKNAAGKALRTFKIVCGDKLSLTPSMGWNDWYAYYDHVTDKLLREAADVMVKKGMADVGYQYVSIDDCWANTQNSSDPKRVGPFRDAKGNILPNKYFPDMKAMTDYIHSRGLKAGIYTSPGPLTCAGYAGTWQHEAKDIQQFADWGFDLLKYDWCTYPDVCENKHDLDTLKRPYILMGKLLKKQKRDILYNLCQYGEGKVWEWGAEVGGQSWRTAGDLGHTKDKIYEVALQNAKYKAYSKPGCWNDPDYLIIGNIGVGEGKVAPCALSPNEQYAYMSMWCLMASPLFYGGDITSLDDFTLNVLCNAEVIEIDQDPLGKSADVAKLSDKTFLMVKQLEDGGKAVGLFNRDTEDAKITAKWSDIGVTGKQAVRDLWRQKDLGEFDGEFTANVGRRGVVLIRVGPQTVGGNITVVQIDMPGVVVLRSPGQAKDKDGFAPMFNGKDLSGWDGEREYWSVEDGAITGKTTAEKPLNRQSYLFWQGGKPADFELRAEFRFVGSEGNSGINFRSKRLPNWDVKGYQADMETGPSYTGILYECNQREIMCLRGQKVVIDKDGRREATTVADSAELQKRIKPDEWNQYAIIARGPEIILKINGAVMSHVIDRQEGKAAAKGCITLQIHPGPPMKVQFKNIRIKKM